MRVFSSMFSYTLNQVLDYPTDTGPADYVLFVNRNAVGVIEAKKDTAGENLTVTESQTERYATATLLPQEIEAARDERVACRKRGGCLAMSWMG